MKDEEKFQRALDELFEYCDGCNSQTCYGQHGTRLKCKYWKRILKSYNIKDEEE